MKTLLTKAGLGATLAATALTAAAPADAQWRRGYYRDRDNTGAAVVAGIAGLAIRLSQGLGPVVPDQQDAVGRQAGGGLGQQAVEGGRLPGAQAIEDDEKERSHGLS